MSRHAVAALIIHVADPAAFLSQLTARLKPDGLLLLSTPNRTAASRLLLVEAAERLVQAAMNRGGFDNITALIMARA